MNSFLSLFHLKNYGFFCYFVIYQVIIGEIF
jgi:hypothetical protein